MNIRSMNEDARILLIYMETSETRMHRALWRRTDRENDRWTADISIFDHLTGVNSQSEMTCNISSQSYRDSF